MTSAEWQRSLCQGDNEPRHLVHFQSHPLNPGHQFMLILYALTAWIDQGREWGFGASGCFSLRNNHSIWDAMLQPLFVSEWVIQNCLRKDSTYLCNKF